MNELIELIKVVQLKYDFVSESWKNSSEYKPLHMKKVRVEDIYKDESFLLYVLSYRIFINNNVSDVVSSIQQLQLKSIINSRVKAYNSIQSKIQSYANNHENGKIPLKKCLNDILGLRIILDTPINYIKIRKFIEKSFPRLKCIERNIDEYYAVHIYFGNEDNYKFQWELQIWDKEHEKTNLDSHARYKQNYTRWEQENNN